MHDDNDNDNEEEETTKTKKKTTQQRQTEHMALYSHCTCADMHTQITVKSDIRNLSAGKPRYSNTHP